MITAYEVSKNPGAVQGLDPHTVGAVLSNLGQRGELRKEMTQLSLTQAGGQHRRL